tara:strand:- start:43 stop:447 length:405 start_codon:yes stop_codon:yes gene_type:complete
MGDPECQVILPRLDGDLLKIITKSLNNQLNETKIKWKKVKCMSIVLCSKGYPGKYKKNKILYNLEKIKNKKNFFIFHAGTKLFNNKIISIGGRVLNISSTGQSYKIIREKILKIIKKINWKNGFFRKDIGFKVI